MSISTPKSWLPHHFEKKLFLLWPKWNVQSYKENACLQIWARGDFFPLGITWNVQICTEHSCVLAPILQGLEISFTNLFARNCMTCLDPQRKIIASPSPQGVGINNVIFFLLRIAWNTQIWNEWHVHQHPIIFTKTLWTLGFCENPRVSCKTLVKMRVFTESM